MYGQTIGVVNGQNPWLSVDRNIPERVCPSRERCRVRLQQEASDKRALREKILNNQVLLFSN